MTNVPNVVAFRRGLRDHDHPLTASQTAVAFTMAEYASDGRGQVMATHAKIAASSRTSEATVRRAIGSMRAAGMLEESTRPGWRGRVYQLLAPDFWEGMATNDRCHTRHHDGVTAHHEHLTAHHDGVTAHHDVLTRHHDRQLKREEQEERKREEAPKVVESTSPSTGPAPPASPPRVPSPIVEEHVSTQEPTSDAGCDSTLVAEVLRSSAHVEAAVGDVDRMAETLLGLYRGSDLARPVEVLLEKLRWKVETTPPNETGRQVLSSLRWGAKSAWDDHRSRQRAQEPDRPPTAAEMGWRPPVPDGRMDAVFEAILAGGDGSVNDIEATLASMGRF